MKQFLWVCAIALGCAVGGSGLVAGAQRQVPTAGTASDAAPQALVQQYCVTCHNDRSKQGGLSLENQNIADAGNHPELWEKVVRKLRAGLMPPPGVRRPPLSDYDALRDWLEAESQNAQMIKKQGSHHLPSNDGRYKCRSSQARGQKNAGDDRDGSQQATHPCPPGNALENMPARETKSECQWTER